MNDLRKLVFEMLQDAESAPSAVVLTYSFAFNIKETPDNVVEMAYNRSEGANDTLVEAMLRWMSDEQVEALKKDMIDYAAEQMLE